MAVKPGSNLFYEIRAILASFAKSDDFFPGTLPIMDYTGRGGFARKGYFFQACTAAPEMLPTPKWSPTLKWSQFDPEMTPIPKWSPCLFTSTPKWSPVNSWNGVVFHHGIITSLLHRLRSWIAFNISLNYVIFSVRLSSPLCLFLHLQYHIKIWKSAKTPFLKSLSKVYSFIIIFRI